MFRSPPPSAASATVDDDGGGGGSGGGSSGGGDDDGTGGSGRRCPLTLTVLAYARSRTEAALAPLLLSLTSLYLSLGTNVRVTSTLRPRFNRA